MKTRTVVKYITNSNKRVLLTCIIFSLLLFFIFFPHIVLRKLQFKEIANLKNSEFLDVIAIDVDNDGYDEIVTSNLYKPNELEENFFLCVYKYLSFPFSQVNFGNHKILNIQSVDFDQDGNDEIFLCYQTTQGELGLLFIKYTFLPEGRTRKIYKAKYKPLYTGKNGEACYIKNIVDLDGDGKSEIIGVYSNTDNVREIFALERDSLSTIWQFTTPVSVTSISVLDINKDGKSELLCSTMPYINNNSDINGLTDNKAWMFLLDYQGNLIWKTELGNHPGFVDCVVDDIITNDVIIIKGSFLNEENYVARAKISLTGLQIQKKIKFYDCIPPQSGLYKHTSLVKGRKFFYLVDSRGRILCYDFNLKLHREYNDKSIVFLPMESHDIDNDGYPEIPAFSLNGELLFLNWELNQIGSIPEFISHDWNKHYALLLRHGDQYRLITADKNNNTLKMFIINRRFIISNSFIYILLVLIPTIVIYQLRIRMIEKNKIRLEKIIKEKTQELNAQYQKVMDSIRYTSIIQTNMLPKSEHIKSLFQDSYCLWFPVDVVGGDFYWFHQDVTSKRIYVALIDCTGHGVPGAIMSVLVLSALSHVFDKESDFNLTDKIISVYSEVQRYLVSDTDSNIDDSFVISILEIDCINKSIQLLTYGQSVIEKKQGCASLIRSPKQIFIRDLTKITKKVFTTRVLPYEKDNVYYLFSDGICDQLIEGKTPRTRMGVVRLTGFLNNGMTMLEEQIMLEEFLKRNIRLFGQRDDISILAIRLP